VQVSDGLKEGCAMAASQSRQWAKQQLGCGEDELQIYVSRGWVREVTPGGDVEEETVLSTQRVLQHAKDEEEGARAGDNDHDGMS
jgi:hypothetical protein